MKFRILLAFAMLQSDMIINGILIILIGNILYRIDKKILDISLTKSTKECIKKYMKGNLVVALPIIITEEMHKFISTRIGLTKEYFIIFNLTEFSSYLQKYKNQPTTTTISTFLKTLNTISSSRIEEIIKSNKKHKITLRKIISGERNINKIDYEEARKLMNQSYKKFIKDELKKARYTAISMHLISTILHKYGLSDIALLVHFLWNYLVAIAYKCIDDKRKRELLFDN